VTNLQIGTDGTVSGINPGSTEISNLGSISVVTFPNPSGLKSIGRSTYLETPASGSATTETPGANGAGTLRQGFLEGSNVNVAEELIRMVLAQRAFEMNSKVIRTSDEMMNSMNQMR
jgi:flagellar basal-body rod protein FlgG